MLRISDEERWARYCIDNPWWETGGIEKRIDAMPKRSFFRSFYSLVVQSTVHRAVLLLGPRRVGKTIMATHLIGRLLDEGESPDHILYLSLETPVYTGLSLEGLITRFTDKFGHDRTTLLTIIFDEIQYLDGWEVHLKSLVDTYSNWRFLVTGSAASALRAEVGESGAGRFTTFLLPPLLFEEYLRFSGNGDLVSVDDRGRAATHDIEALNGAYIDYVNVGGYPEPLFSNELRNEIGRFVRSDVIERVLLRDLPSLYGISNISELNRLFTTLAFNSGNQLSPEAISQESAVAKGTIERYMEYLETAFLIRRLLPVRSDGTNFRRVPEFKVYLSNASMRSVLFAPVGEDDEPMGLMNETAIVAQRPPASRLQGEYYYARLRPGEVDLVRISEGDRRVIEATELKWSDRIARNPLEKGRGLTRALEFARAHGLGQMVVTTRRITTEKVLGNINVIFIPSALYCYMVGLDTLEQTAG